VEIFDKSGAGRTRQHPRAGALPETLALPRHCSFPLPQIRFHRKFRRFAEENRFSIESRRYLPKHGTRRISALALKNNNQSQ
jgi:hypothetical protein